MSMDTKDRSSDAECCSQAVHRTLSRQSAGGRGVSHSARARRSHVLCPVLVRAQQVWQWTELCPASPKVDVGFHSTPPARTRSVSSPHVGPTGVAGELSPGLVISALPLGLCGLISSLRALDYPVAKGDQHLPSQAVVLGGHELGGFGTVPGAECVKAKWRHHYNCSFLHPWGHLPAQTTPHCFLGWIPSQDHNGSSAARQLWASPSAREPSGSCWEQRSWELGTGFMA